MFQKHVATRTPWKIDGNIPEVMGTRAASGSQLLVNMAMTKSPELSLEHSHESGARKASIDDFPCNKISINLTMFQGVVTMFSRKFSQVEIPMVFPIIFPMGFSHGLFSLYISHVYGRS